MVYLDDILVFSDTAEDHYRHLREVLERLREAPLYAKPSKCIFAQNKLEFCGHIVIAIVKWNPYGRRSISYGMGLSRRLPMMFDNFWASPRTTNGS